VQYRIGEKEEDSSDEDEDEDGASETKKKEEGEKIEGATGAQFEIEGLGMDEAAKFYCRVANSAGTIRSRNVRLRVNCPPFLQPREGNKPAVQVHVGRVCIKVAVKATPDPALQWYSREDSNDTNEYELRGKTTNTIDVDPLRKGIYNVEAENSAGKIVVPTFAFPMEGGLLNGLQKYGPSK
jgi:hypothetical protein